MSTNTFDRPLELKTDEEIEYFWNAYNNAPVMPLKRNPEMIERMRRCEKLLDTIPLR